MPPPTRAKGVGKWIWKNQTNLLGILSLVVAVLGIFLMEYRHDNGTVCSNFPVANYTLRWPGEGFLQQWGCSGERLELHLLGKDVTLTHNRMTAMAETPFYLGAAKTAVFRVGVITGPLGNTGETACDVGFLIESVNAPFGYPAVRVQLLDNGRLDHSGLPYTAGTLVEIIATLDVPSNTFHLNINGNDVPGVFQAEANGNATLLSMISKFQVSSNHGGIPCIFLNPTITLS